MPPAARLTSRRLWLECDVHADPIWETSGRTADLDALALSVALRRELRAWADDYDAMTAVSFEFTREQDREMTRRGRRLARQVQEELGDGWEIGYLDYERNLLTWPSDIHSGPK